MPEEFKKFKPHIFDGKNKKVGEVKEWLLGLKIYFRFHNYSDNMKARVAIFNLKGKGAIWWEDLRNVKGNKEKYIS